MSDRRKKEGGAKGGLEKIKEDFKDRLILSIY